MAGELWVVRHGETEWSKAGQHTSRTDLPLTDHGREQACEAAGALAGVGFSLVLCSPLLRARETCRLLGFEQAAELCDDLREWEYGDYEGITTAEIHADRPDWDLWRDGCPGGESGVQVGARVDRVIARAASVLGSGSGSAGSAGSASVAAGSGSVAAGSASVAGSGSAVLCVAHGHVLRVLTARWLGMDVSAGAHFALATAGVGVLGFEHETTPVLSRWSI
jgi:broad specificity phosphatase PhoE